MIEQHFGESAAFSLGVEEELVLVDADTLELTPGVRTVIAECDGLELPGRLKTELFGALVELNTDVCDSAHEALAALRTLRAATADAAERHGMRIAATGTHPFSRPEEQEVLDEPRYLEFVRYAGSAARRQGVMGLHVHVGVPDAEACLRVLETVLPWLPAVLALSANSPYLAGAETGLASTRAEVLTLLPRNGAPPVFASYADWEAAAERMVGLGLLTDYTGMWWDVRPHPRFGTLEVRMPDQPTRVELSGAFVALLQGLCATALDDGLPGLRPADRALYQESRWAAAHRGPRAMLPHPDGGRLVEASALGAELLERVGPAAERLGSAELLAVLDPGTCEGDRQLELGRADGVEAVAADLVERTVRS